MVAMLRRLFRRPALALTFLFGLLLFGIFFFFFQQFLLENNAEKRFFEENYLAIGDSISSSSSSSSSQTPSNGPKRLHACNLPLDFSPFDPSISAYLETHPKSVVCSGSSSFRPSTVVDREAGQLRLLPGTTSGDCEFRRLTKQTHEEVTVKYGEWEAWPSEGAPVSLPYSENYINVRCDGVENLHFHFNASAVQHFSTQPLLTQNEKRKRKRRNKNGFAKSIERPNVIFLVIESLSRLNYLRYLPQTKVALESTLGNTFYLDGLNKMADNSFPNMVPLLTGRRLYKGELPGDENVGPYDEWPFIWKNFSRQLGYITALVEDYPAFTLFNYNAEGFTKEQPTDWYPRPFWQHLFSDVPAFMQKVFPFNISPCYKGRTPKVDIFLKQVEAMLEGAARGSRPLFAFSFYIELTHNNFNKAQMIDAHLANFISRSAAHLNESIFVVMGDHGNRFGAVLQTTIGRIEERMPLFAIHLPHKLTERYPHLTTNLAANRRRLSTWLDVNEMLNDIIQGNFTDKGSGENESENSVSLKRAYSPWREEIPPKRSCSAALIDDLYCACDRRLALDVHENVLAINASAVLIATLNSMLSEAGEKGKGCSQLTLKEILRAEFIFPSDSTAQARGYAQKIEITVSVMPSEGIFRARLRRTYRQLEWTVEGGQVTRINEYGDQPWCIGQRNIKPFCFCSTPRPTSVSSNSTSVI